MASIFTETCDYSAKKHSDTVSEQYPVSDVSIKGVDNQEFSFNFLNKATYRCRQWLCAQGLPSF